MKLVILGSLERKEKDLPIIEEAQKIFDTALYVPVDHVKLGAGNDLGAWFKKTDLSNFDAVLPIPTYSNKEFYYTCLRILEKKVYTPIPSDKFFIMWNKPLLLKLFSNNGIKTRKVSIVACEIAANTIINQLKLPVIITPPSRKRVLITNKDTLKSVLSLFKPGYTIIVEKPIKPKSMIWVFVVGDEVVASYEKNRQGRKRIIIDEDLKKLAIKIRKSISSDFCAINFIKTKSQNIVNEITLSPDFSLYQDVTGKNISRALLTYLESKIKEEKRTILDRIVDSITDTVKWFKNEISNIRTIGERV